ncbi:MAG: DUF2147 domain-containing protein [Polaribacter sp.]
MKKLRNVVVLIAISLFSLNSFAQSDIAGKYVVGEQNTIVKIEPQEDVFLGKITSSDNPKAKIGKLMVKDLKEKKGKWKGKVYSPKRKEWFDAEFIPKKNTLDVKIKVGFFSKTMKWTRK